MRYGARGVWLGLGLFLAVAGLGLWWLSGERQPAPWRIAALHLTPVDAATFRGFQAGMAELGYAEGRNVVYRYAGAVGDIAKLDAVAARLVDEGADLIFVSSTPATLAVQRATQERPVPVVFAPVNDPVASGIVRSLQQPGGHITGIRLPLGDDLRLQWLTRIAPEARRVYLPYNPEDKSALSSLAQAQAAAPLLGVELIAQPLKDAAEIRAALAALPDTAQAIFLPRDSTLEAQIAEFVAVAKQRRLPVAAPSQTQVEAGALFSYGFIHHEIGRQAARLAAQILRGSHPADLPVEMAENYLSINLDTARAIGLALPDSVLLQAERIVRE